MGRRQRGSARQDLLDPGGARIDALQAAILEWYAQAARDLPWRRTSDPYAILVSEVMLQQTQVARVQERWTRWLQRWPRISDLAAAPTADVLAEWSGLGYNRRALALSKAARHVAAHGWPRDAAGLRALPGVGPYTAAAVASFCFGEPVAAVDTNTRRVAERLGADPAELLPAGRHADFNQAMMELGATVCTARRADCDRCPAAPWCPSRGAVVVAPRRRGTPRERFEDSDRWARGRIVAALTAGEALPDLDPVRRRRVVDGLVRDGLVVRRGAELQLPLS